MSKLIISLVGNNQQDTPFFYLPHTPEMTISPHKLVFRFIPKMMRFARNDYMAKTILSYMPLLKRYSYIALQEERSEFAASLATFNNLLVNVLKRDAAAAEEKILQYGHNQCQIVLRALKKRMAETEKA